MSYYVNAESKKKAAELLLESGSYDSSISLFCLAAELYLKSRLDRLPVEEQDRFELTHDTIGLYNSLAKKFEGSSQLFEAVKMCKKYFSESRYISNGNLDFYTKELAKDFAGYVEIIKDYVNMRCAADIEDLAEKYQK